MKGEANMTETLNGTRSDLEREAEAITEFAAELPETVPTEQVAARYSADKTYHEAREQFEHGVELVTEAVGRALWGEDLSGETLDKLPEVLRVATNELCEAVEEATAVARGDAI
jgi:hypothetical protein